MACEPMPLRALVMDADPAMAGLLAEWLEAQGFCVFEAIPDGHCDLSVADVPQPRLGAPDFLRQAARRHPGTPILALSSHFLRGADAAVAQALGVAAVLPKPVTRDALAATVKKLV